MGCTSGPGLALPCPGPSCKARRSGGGPVAEPGLPAQHRPRLQQPVYLCDSLMLSLLHSQDVRARGGRGQHRAVGEARTAAPRGPAASPRPHALRCPGASSPLPHRLQVEARGCKARGRQAHRWLWSAA